MNKKDLLKLVGSVDQIGGIKDYTFNQGKAKGVRVLEIDTGKICFTVLPDRCMDITHASFENINVSWISKTGIVSPYFYEKDGLSWLRGFTGGLITTCGFKNIGSPTEEHGLHGRLSNIPATNVSIFADWVGDDYVMKICGEIRESAVFGTNLVLKRTITTKLFSSSFTVEDIIENEGFTDEGIAYCYHCNYGYPLVREGAKITNVPSDIADITGPIRGKEEECIDVNLEGDVQTVGIENGEIGAYITYERKNLPCFLVWKMLGESEYVVGLEPRTTNKGGKGIKDANEFVILKPFEKFDTKLEFSFKKL